MAKDYTEEEIQEIKETFYFFDKEGKGLVPETKVGTMMRLLGVYLRENEIQKLIAEVNVTQDRKIDYIAFLKIMNMLRWEDSGNREITDQKDCIWCKTWAFTSGKSRQKVALERRVSRCQAKSRLCQALSELDVNKDGCVTVEDLSSMILSQPMTFAEQGEVEKMISDLNSDGDERVSYQEFVNLMTSNNTRRRISLQALLHAATFCRRMEKIYLKMDPLQPSPSEEALLLKIQSSIINESKTGVGKQSSKKEPSKHEDENRGSHWKKAKKSVGPNPEYAFMKSFSNMFSKISTKPRAIKNTDKLKKYVLLKKSFLTEKSEEENF